MKSPARWQAPFLALLLAALLPATALAQAPVEGQDYVRIEGGEPWQPLDGQVEVVEIFAYACHVCDRFEPMLKAWERTQPDDVRVTRLPVAYNVRDAFATAFFAAEAMGELDAVHAATFDAIHRRGILARNATHAEIAAFYAQLGVDRGEFGARMQAPETARKLEAAHQFLRASGAEGTPTLVVNGKYRVLGRTLGEMLEIAEQLVELERAP